MKARFRPVCACVFALTFAVALHAQTNGPGARWLRNAKFGVMFRWGLYSIPAGEWNGQAADGSAEEILRSAKIGLADYEKLASQFNPRNFDATAWVKAAKGGGAKYIVATAKDSDGFSMYRSAASKYNVFDATPFHRDPLRELADAAVKQGVRFGIYYSLARDAHDLDTDFDRYLQTKVEPQLKELLARYPVSVIWFDNQPLPSAAAAARIQKLVRTARPLAAIAGLPNLGDVTLTDDPAATPKGDWILALPMNHSWGFNKFDHQWRASDDLIFNLIDTASRGGGFLLGVGPTADGLISRPTAPELATVGEWCKENGDALYSVGAGPLSSESPKLRSTTKPGKIYVTLFKWPEGRLELDGLQRRIAHATFLSDEEESALKFTQTGGHLTVELPKDPPFSGEMPERMNPRLFAMGLRAHLHSVLVLETAASR
jgi:alpha-L-fucosidase